MSWWRAKHTNDHGEYEVTFGTKYREKAEAIEKVCKAVVDKLVNRPEDVLIASDACAGMWIPTEDRLPDRELEEFREKFGWEGDPELLVMIKGAKVPTTLYYNEEGEFYSIDTDGNDTYYVVTHWMPMPFPPAWGNNYEKG